ncbi:MAG TPA: phosphoribosyltransferase family protein [Tahibacter sp.]|nr:phosphoribosyltransferase family protein [Tahibacter sp.]
MSADRYCLYDADDLHAVIESMARQTVALLDATPTTLLGLLRRGAPLAQRLAEAVRRLAPDADLACADLLVKRYADNLELLYPQTHLEAAPDLVLRGRRVIVVDDVLYQGLSLFRVFEWLRTQEAAAAHAAVLVDRQRYVVPIRADIVGVTLKIAPGDVIECNVPPYETEFAIDLWRPGAGDQR